MKIYIILVCTQQQWGFTSDACWFLLIKSNKKREAALKNEAGGDEKRGFFFFTWPNRLERRIFCFSRSQYTLLSARVR